MIRDVRLTQALKRKRKLFSDGAREEEGVRPVRIMESMTTGENRMMDENVGSDLLVR